MSVIVLPTFCVIYIFGINAEMLGIQGYDKMLEPFCNDMRYKTKQQRAFMFFYVMRRLLFLILAFSEYTKENLIFQIAGMYAINTIATIY